MIEYIKDSYKELTQSVTLPSKAETQRLMIIVVVFSTLFSLFISAVDKVFEKAIAFILNIV